MMHSKFSLLVAASMLAGLLCTKVDRSNPFDAQANDFQSPNPPVIQSINYDPDSKSIFIKWSSVANAQNYIINRERVDVAILNDNYQKSIPGSYIAYYDSLRLAPHATYQYKMAAMFAGGAQTKFSAVFEVTTPMAL
jgi:hypothetical protein